MLRAKNLKNPGFFEVFELVLYKDADEKTSKNLNLYASFFGGYAQKITK
jgi:hypothetical protein